MSAPPGALTWASPAERNRLLLLWRRAVFAIFGGCPRCIRLWWVLTDLFNVKSGYDFPINDYLAEQTNLWISHLREALLILESGGTIVRIAMPHESDTDMADVLIGHGGAYRGGQHDAA